MSYPDDVDVFACATDAVVRLKERRGRPVWMDDYGCIAFGRPDYPGHWRCIAVEELYRMAEVGSREAG